MTATTDMVGFVSPFVLGSDYTQAQFDQFVEWAAHRVGREAPNLDPTDVDEAVVLLVCHRIEVSKGRLGRESNKSGDVSYTQRPGQSTWLLEYYQLIGSQERPAPYRGVLRDDVETSRKFRMSNTQLPRMDSPRFR